MVWCAADKSIDRIVKRSKKKKKQYILVIRGLLTSLLCILFTNIIQIILFLTYFVSDANVFILIWYVMFDTTTHMGYIYTSLRRNLFRFVFNEHKKFYCFSLLLLFWPGPSTPRNLVT